MKNSNSGRELLEQAAKAMGVVGEYRSEHQTYGDQFVDGIDTGARFWWNPLTDDGDALRLAVACDINVSRDYDYDTNEPKVTAYRDDGEICVYWTETCGEDPLTATRRAIVRAAAEIGSARSK